jgi:hypothetical protein
LNGQRPHQHLHGREPASTIGPIYQPLRDDTPENLRQLLADLPTMAHVVRGLAERIGGERGPPIPQHAQRLVPGLIAGCSSKV